jgi:hypothetical protein
MRIEVMATDDGPVLRTTILGPLAEVAPDPVSELPMTAAGPDVFVVREPEFQTWTPVTFYELRTGEKYVYFGARATPKVRAPGGGRRRCGGGGGDQMPWWLGLVPALCSQAVMASCQDWR